MPFINWLKNLSRSLRRPKVAISPGSSPGSRRAAHGLPSLMQYDLSTSYPAPSTASVCSQILRVLVPVDP